MPRCVVVAHTSASLSCFIIIHNEGTSRSCLKICLRLAEGHVGRLLANSDPLQHHIEQLANSSRLLGVSKQWAVWIAGAFGKKLCLALHGHFCFAHLTVTVHQWLLFILSSRLVTHLALRWWNKLVTLNSAVILWFRHTRWVFVRCNIFGVRAARGTVHLCRRPVSRTQRVAAQTDSERCHLEICCLSASDE